MPVNHTVKVLSELVQASEDGEKGFAEASQEATRPELKAMFRQRSDDCATAAIELQALLQSLGGPPEDGATIAGAAHRGWARGNAALADPNFDMLEEGERAADKAKAAYLTALTIKLPEQVRGVVQRQLDDAIRTHDTIRELRNGYQASDQAAIV